MNLLDLAIKVTVDDSGVDSSLNKITSSFEKVKNNVGSVIKTCLLSVTDTGRRNWE